MTPRAWEKVPCSKPARMFDICRLPRNATFLTLSSRITIVCAVPVQPAVPEPPCHPEAARQCRVHRLSQLFAVLCRAQVHQVPFVSVILEEHCLGPAEPNMQLPGSDPPSIGTFAAGGVQTRHIDSGDCGQNGGRGISSEHGRIEPVRLACRASQPTHVHQAQGDEMWNRHDTQPF